METWDMKICNKKSLNLEKKTEEENRELEWGKHVKKLSTWIGTGRRKLGIWIGWLKNKSLNLKKNRRGKLEKRVDTKYLLGETN